MFHFRRVRVGEGGKEGGLSQKNTIFSIAQLCPRILSFARSMLCQKIKTPPHENIPSCSVRTWTRKHTLYTKFSHHICQVFLLFRLRHNPSAAHTSPRKKNLFSGASKSVFSSCFPSLLSLLHCLSFSLLTWVIYGVQSLRESSRADFLIVILHAVNGFDIIQLFNKLQQKYFTVVVTPSLFLAGTERCHCCAEPSFPPFSALQVSTTGTHSKVSKRQRNRYLLHRMTES